MKKNLLLLSILLLYQISLGQSVDWQRQFLVGARNSSVQGIINFNESTLYSAIAARTWGYVVQNPANTAYGIGLVKVKASTGDTVFVRRIQGWTSSIANMKLHKSFEGNLVIASKSVGDTVLDSKILIQKVDTNGNSIWKLTLSAGLNDPQVSKVLPTPDGGTLVMGSDFSTIGGLQDWLLIKVSYNGQLQWTQRFNGGNNWYCKGNNIEPMRNGHYLLSGMAERLIWSVEIDENGNQLDEDTVWFGTAPNLVFDAVIRQTPYQSIVASGTYGSNPIKYFFGKFDVSGNKIWGGERIGFEGSVLATMQDGNILTIEHNTLSSDSSFFKLYGPDSALLWVKPVPISGIFSVNATINDLAFDGLGGAVVSGTAKKLNGTGDELLFMKISGIGLPYDPFADTIPLGTKAPKWAKPLKVYPNPGSGDVWFSGLEGRLELSLYATDGRRVFEGWTESGSPVSLTHLPSGMYTYVARKGDQKWSGRWIKELGIEN